MTVREWAAEHRRASIWMNLGELNLVLDALLDAGAGRRKSDLRGVARRVERSRDRLLRRREAAGRA